MTDLFTRHPLPWRYKRVDNSSFDLFDGDINLVARVSMPLVIGDWWPANDLAALIIRAAEREEAEIAKKTCPECGKANGRMFTADLDQCPDCGCTYQGR